MKSIEWVTLDVLTENAKFLVLIKSPESRTTSKEGSYKYVCAFWRVNTILPFLLKRRLEMCTAMLFGRRLKKKPIQDAVLFEMGSIFNLLRKEIAD